MLALWEEVLWLKNTFKVVKKVKNSNYILVQDGENGCIRWMKRLGKSGSVILGLSLFQYQSKPSRTEIFSHI